MKANSSPFKRLVFWYMNHNWCWKENVRNINFFSASSGFECFNCLNVCLSGSEVSTGSQWSPIIKITSQPRQHLHAQKTELKSHLFFCSHSLEVNFESVSWILWYFSRLMTLDLWTLRCVNAKCVFFLLLSVRYLRMQLMKKQASKNGPKVTVLYPSLEYCIGNLKILWLYVS